MKIFNQHHPFVILDWEAFKRLLKKMDRGEVLDWFVNERVITPDDFTMFKQEPDDDKCYEALFIELEESLK